MKIKVKGARAALVLGIGDLNSRSTMMERHILARLPSFIHARLPSNEHGLKPGNPWHWKAFASKFLRIAVLVSLSGHACRGLEHTKAHETFLKNKEKSLFIMKNIYKNFTNFRL